MQRENIYFEDISTMYFFIEFSIPWGLKWSIEVKLNPDNVPCLMRIYYTKFWGKLNQQTAEGNVHGHQLIETIKAAINNYKQQKEITLFMNKRNTVHLGILPENSR